MRHRRSFFGILLSNWNIVNNFHRRCYLLKYTLKLKYVDIFSTPSTLNAHNPPSCQNRYLKLKFIPTTTTTIPSASLNRPRLSANQVTILLETSKDWKLNRRELSNALHRAIDLTQHPKLENHGPPTEAKLRKVHFWKIYLPIKALRRLSIKSRLSKYWHHCLMFRRVFYCQLGR